MTQRVVLVRCSGFFNNQLRDFIIKAISSILRIPIVNVSSNESVEIHICCNVEMACAIKIIQYKNNCVLFHFSLHDQRDNREAI